MNILETQYLLLVYPICMVLIGAVFVAAHLFFKAPKYLFWIGLGCVLSSFGLGAQSLMTNEQLRQTAPWFSLFYLGGVWAVVHGILLKAHSKSNIFIASVLIVVGMALLLYFTHVNEQLWSRIIIINIVILCLEALALPKVYVLFKRTYALEKLLCFSYFLIFAYGVIRALIVIIHLQHVLYVNPVTTPWWVIMVSLNLLLGLWFAIIVSAVAVKEKFDIINQERLRDPLTKLYNRNGFLEKTKDVFNELQGGEVYLVMCDIDKFKNINDTWGHAVGDEILSLMADILSSNIRQGDVVGRFGGEEFIILLQSPNEESSFTLVERLRKKIEDQLFIKNIRVTASFGAARIMTDSQLSIALELADQRLYHAKNNGRNRVCFN